MYTIPVAKGAGRSVIPKTCLSGTKNVSVPVLPGETHKNDSLRTTRRSRGGAARGGGTPCATSRAWWSSAGWQRTFLRNKQRSCQLMLAPAPRSQRCSRRHPVPAPRRQLVRRTRPADRAARPLGVGSGRGIRTRARARTHAGPSADRSAEDMATQRASDAYARSGPP